MENLNRRKFLNQSIFCATGIAIFSLASSTNLAQLVKNQNQVKLIGRVKFIKDLQQFVLDSGKWIDNDKLLEVFNEQVKTGNLISVKTDSTSEYFEIQLIFKNYQSYLICDKQYDAMTDKALRKQMGYSVQELLFDINA